MLDTQAVSAAASSDMTGRHYRDVLPILLMVTLRNVPCLHLATHRQTYFIGVQCEVAGC